MKAIRTVLTVILVINVYIGWAVWMAIIWFLLEDLLGINGIISLLLAVIAGPIISVIWLTPLGMLNRYLEKKSGDDGSVKVSS